MTDPQERLGELIAQIIEISDAVHDLDARTLAAMTPDERAGHTEVRYRLHRYFDDLWSTLGAPGRHASHHPDSPAVGALRDLTSHLWTTAQDVQDTAGDDVDGVTVSVTVTRDGEGYPRWSSEPGNTGR